MTAVRDVLAASAPASVRREGWWGELPPPSRRGVRRREREDLLTGALVRGELDDELAGELLDLAGRSGRWWLRRAVANAAGVDPALRIRAGEEGDAWTRLSVALDPLVVPIPVAARWVSEVGRGLGGLTVQLEALLETRPEVWEHLDDQGAGPLLSVSTVPTHVAARWTTLDVRREGDRCALAGLAANPGAPRALREEAVERLWRHRPQAQRELLRARALVVPSLSGPLAEAGRDELVPLLLWASGALGAGWLAPRHGALSELSAHTDVYEAWEEVRRLAVRAGAQVREDPFLVSAPLGFLAALPGLHTGPGRRRAAAEVPTWAGDKVAWRAAALVPLSGRNPLGDELAGRVVTTCAREALGDDAAAWEIAATLCETQNGDVSALLQGARMLAKG